MFILKAIGRGLILPPTSSLILILIGTILVWRGRRFGWSVFVVGFVSLWLLCTPIVADQLSLLVERYPALDPTRPVNAQTKLGSHQIMTIALESYTEGKWAAPFTPKNGSTLSWAVTLEAR